MSNEFDSLGTTEQSGDDDSRSAYRMVGRTRLLFWVVALAIGFIQAWSNRFAVSEDGLAYADMGDMLWRGDFQSAVNAIWSPGYPFLLGLAFKVVQPTPYFQSTVIQLANMVIFAGSMASFDFFLRQLYRLYQDRSILRESTESLTMPGWVFWAIGYMLFLWSALVLTNVSTITPDMLLSVFVFLAFGLLVRIRLGDSSNGAFALLGVTLGVGYLSKAPMYIVAFFLLASAALLVKDFRIGLRRGLLALSVFAVLAAPWVIAISTQTGSPTFGKSGAYLYAREVNDIAMPVHWQGWPPTAGTPEHPSRTIFTRPEVYEFGAPVGGSYPPWQDIYYWYKGINPHFDLVGQLRVIRKNAGMMLHIVLGAQSNGLLFGLCVMLAMSGSATLLKRRLTTGLFIFIPAIAALAMFSLILVGGRYVAPYLAVIGSALLLAVILPKSDVMRRLLHRVAWLIIVFWCIDIVLSYLSYTTVQRTGVSVLNAIRAVDPRELNPNYEVAVALKENGLHEGDKVAYIGESFNFYWARLAKVQVNAEVRQFQTEGPPTSYASDFALARLRSDELRHVDHFWKSGPSIQKDVMATFKRAGSKAVVTDAIPIGQDAIGWIPIPRTRYHIHVF